jgi:hypothetical protein
VTAVLAILACVWLMASATLTDFLVLAIVILIGAIIGGAYHLTRPPPRLAPESID